MNSDFFVFEVALQSGRGWFRGYIGAKTKESAIRKAKEIYSVEAEVRSCTRITHSWLSAVCDD
jgi:hypothetical protein